MAHSLQQQVVDTAGRQGRLMHVPRVRPWECSQYMVRLSTASGASRASGASGVVRQRCSSGASVPRCCDMAWLRGVAVCLEHSAAFRHPVLSWHAAYDAQHQCSPAHVRASKAKRLSPVGGTGAGRGKGHGP